MHLNAVLVSFVIPILSYIVWSMIFKSEVVDVVYDVVIDLSQGSLHVLPPLDALR